MTLDFLVSTIDGKLPVLLDDIPKQSPRPSLTIIHQYSDPSQTHFFPEGTHHFHERGLSRSRNRGLELASGDIALLCDDDSRILDNAASKILQEFERHQDADIICFQIRTPEGEPFRNYPPSPRWVGKRGTFHICSVEIAFRRERILEKGLRFDERFGLGSLFPTGEEAIFLTDALKRGLRIRYAPIPIVVHSKYTSGHNFSEPSLIAAKGAMFRRIFGNSLGITAGMAFLFKHWSEISLFWSFLDALRVFLRGFRSLREPTPT